MLKNGIFYLNSVDRGECIPSDHYKFVGTWSNVEELIELRDLPK